MWSLNSENRLQSWKRFRKSISTMPLEEAITATGKLWASAPWTPYYLDADNPSDWPDPWTLLDENYYCDLAKALGIVYTLALSEHNNISAEVRVYKDPNKHYFYNLAWIDDGKYILNMQDGEIVNKEQFDKTLQLQFKYSTKELKLEI